MNVFNTNLVLLLEITELKDGLCLIKSRKGLGLYSKAKVELNA